MSHDPRDWLKPTLCVGDVMHARTRPKRNVFHYPVFYLRLPLSKLNTLNVRGLAINKRGLCQILNQDHGPRDGNDLLIWARTILEQHGLKEVTQGGEIMLQTMPRLFGYQFNPVSFYFCHDRDAALRAVICEVSNTFGERHNYLVTHADHRPIKAHDKLYAQKVFHVSPFFPLGGDYEFRFGGTPHAPVAMINYTAHTTADAHSGSGQYGLRTWLRGQARTLNTSAIYSALCRFPLLTIGVIARIHWQALRLWVLKVSFFSKPSLPLKETST
jgi:uncharacterized protein